MSNLCDVQGEFGHRHLAEYEKEGLQVLDFLWGNRKLYAQILGGKLPTCSFCPYSLFCMYYTHTCIHTTTCSIRNCLVIFVYSM